MRKIVVIRQYATPLSLSGGHRIHRAFSLVSDLYSITTICSDFDHMSKRRHVSFSGLFYSEVENGIRTIFVKTLPYRKSLFVRIISLLGFNILAIIALLIKVRKFDILVASSAPINIPYSFLPLSRIYKSSFVYDVGDLWPDSISCIKPGILYGVLKKVGD